MDLSRHFDKISELNLKGANFSKHLSYLQSCKFPVKPSWLGKFSNFSTTLSKKKIWVANNFHTWKFSSQCANLCHEAVHCIQYDRWGRFHFSIKYAQKAGRLEAEIEANLANIEYFLEVGLVGTRQVNGYIDRIVAGLANDYLLGKWFHPLMQMDVKKQFKNFVRNWKIVRKQAR